MPAFVRFGEVFGRGGWALGGGGALGGGEVWMVSCTSVILH